MGDAIDPIDRLPRAALDRLDRFADAFHLLDSGLYPAFAAASHDPDERAAALDRVQALIGGGPRRAGVIAVLGEFRDFAVRSATEALGGANAVLLTRANTSSPEERLRFLASLELAVVVVLLWDEIDPAEREDLLGPWADMATRAIEGRVV
ncbi:MAG TPA: hypothetical protein VLS28_08115 [Candidatus Sulfomarinibacteraceae bacterium]|nr:hypothetical protein [Candidatus Sulfomarinibacteraceae bacterium]